MTSRCPDLGSRFESGVRNHEPYQRRSRIGGGAADKAGFQLVKVQPYQLPENGYVAMPLLGAGNQPSSAWCIRPGRPRSMVDLAVGAAGRLSECRGLNMSE